MPFPRRRNENLRALLAEARWTQGAFARAVNAVAAEAGLDVDYDRTAVAHWLSGTQPNPPVPEIVAEALTRRLERPVSAGLAGFGGPQAGPVAEPLPRRESGPADRLGDLCRVESDPVRRLPAGTQPYRAAALEDVCRTARTAAPVRDAPGGAARSALGVMRTAVRFHAASFTAHGGGTTRAALAAYLADDVVPRLRAATKEAPQRGLLVEASRLSFLLARMYEDASSHGLAQRHYLVALELAEESGDPLARAVVLRGLSAQGLALGHRRVALQAAEAAAEDAAPGGGPAAAFVLAQLAVAQAACGLHRRALGSLGRAERAGAVEGPAGSADRDEGRAPGPFDAYSRAALEYQSAETLRMAGDASGARAAMSRSLALRSADDHRGLALSHAQRAEMLVATGHVEAACASWRSFLEHYRLLRSGTADVVMARSRKLLIPFRKVPAAAVLLDQLSAELAGGKSR